MHTLTAVVRDRHASWHRDADDRRRLDQARSAAADELRADVAAADHPDPGARAWSTVFHAIRRRGLMGPSRP